MKDPAVQLKILNMEHIICGRRCELRSPKRVSVEKLLLCGLNGVILLQKLPKTATFGLGLANLHREVAALQKYVDCNAVLLFGAREAGCFREVAA